MTIGVRGGGFWPGPWRYSESCDDRAECVRPAPRISCPIDDTLCPLPQLLKWLEAVSCDAPHCAVHFDDGPSSLHFEWGGTILRVEVWEHATRHSPGAHRRFKASNLDCRQVAISFYSAFRNFVESPEYNPVVYEQHSTDMDYALSAIQGRLSQGELIGFLTALDAAALEFFIHLVSLAHSFVSPARFGWGANRQWIAPPLAVLQSTFRGLMSAADIDTVYRKLVSREPEHHRQIVPAFWDRLDAVGRRDRLAALLARTRWEAVGSNLRALRSQHLESLMTLGTTPRQDGHAGPRTISS